MARIDHRGRIEPTLGPRNMLEGETAWSSDRIKMGEIFGTGLTSAGVAVTPQSAMRVSAVYAAVRLIAGAIAGLPKSVYERGANDVGTKIKHDYWWMLNERPCDSHSAATFWEWMIASMLLRKVSVAWIRRNRAGVPIQLVPWMSDRVYVQRLPSGDPRVPPRNQYLFHSEDGSFGAEEEDVLHFPGFGFDGRYSMSVIEWGARNGIGIAQRSDEFAGKFFANGGAPQFAVTTEKKMLDSQKDDFSTAWELKYGGANVGPNIKPLILTEGLKVQQLSMTGKDAQLLESRQWNVVDIARAFGVPPFMIGEMGKATYNNTENLGVDFVKYTLGPHLVRIEQELNIKLFRMPRYYIKCNVDGLQRGDLAARANYYKSALGGTQAPGWMVQNEIRALEDLQPIDGGDELFAPKDTGPASDPPPDDTTPPNNPPPSDPNDDGADPGDDQDISDAQLRRAAYDALRASA